MTLFAQFKVNNPCNKIAFSAFYWKVFQYLDAAFGSAVNIDPFITLVNNFVTPG